MWLGCVQPVCVGPFYPPERIEDRHKTSFERGMTVITGANDTGKSCVLRLVELVCAGDLAAIRSPDDVNRTLLDETGELAESTEEPGWSAWFGVDESSSVRLPRRKQGTYNGTYEVSVRLNHGHANAWYEPQGGQRVKTQPPAAPPTVARVDVTCLLGSEIAFDEQLNRAQEALLRVAFGSNWAAGTFKSSAGRFSTLLRKANQRLAERLERVLPPSLRFDVQIDGTDRQSGRLTLHVTDTVGALTDLGLRGAGLGKLVSLGMVLANTDFGEGHGILVLDEPENSLHADAQHAFREFLQEFARDPRRQVIYATHSPCMVDPWRPESVRLLERRVGDGRPTTVVHNRPHEDGWLPVRRALGVALTDSLLYGGVTICVEGETEIQCLDMVLRGLAMAGERGFQEAQATLSQVAYLDVKGDNYERTCKVVRAHGGNPILLLDGDKVNQRNASRLKDMEPPVPVVFLPEGQTFEDMVPRTTYFESLAAVLGDVDPEARISETVFGQWVEQQLNADR